MPPECLTNNPDYGFPMDIFSFAGIILQYLINNGLVQLSKYSMTTTPEREWRVERHQQYLDKLIGEAEILRPLVEECLDDNPAVRPIIQTVCDKILSIKHDVVKESPPDIITLHQQVDQLRNEVAQHNTEQLKEKKIIQLQCEIIKLK